MSLHSRRQSTRDKHPRTPCGRPIKASEVGSVPQSSISGKGVSRRRATHGSITGSLPGQVWKPTPQCVPKISLCRGFLVGVRPWLASVRPCGSTPRGGVTQGGLRVMYITHLGTGICSRRQRSNAPAWTGCFVAAKYKSKALPCAPQRKHCQQCRSKWPVKDRLRRDDEP